MSQQSFSIGQTATACGVSAKNIRYYEQIGLIPKAPRHNQGARTGGNRLYREDDVRRLRFIRDSRLRGLGLGDIAEMLALSEGSGCPGAQPRYRTGIEDQLAKVGQRIEQLLHFRTTLEELLASADRGGLAGRCGCSALTVRSSAGKRPFPVAVRSAVATRRPRDGRAA